MTGLSSLIWLAVGGGALLLLLILVCLRLWWRPRRIEQARQWEQLSSVHDAREQRIWGD